MKNNIYNEIIIIVVSVLCIFIMSSSGNDIRVSAQKQLESNVSKNIIQVKNISYTNEYAFNSSSSSSGELYKEVFLDSSMYTPIKGVLTSTFGESRNGYYHKGIDLAAKTGTEIGAAMDGKVTYAGTASGYGNVVFIQHDGNRQTVYGHCSELCVKTGDYVSKGQTVAKVGSTGDSTGPHLHFEIRVNGKPVDPLKYNANAVEY